MTHEKNGTYVDDECFDIHEYDDDTDHGTDDDTDDDTDEPRLWGRCICNVTMEKMIRMMILMTILMMVGAGERKIQDFEPGGGG